MSEKLKIARDGKEIGEFSTEELQMLLRREDGGVMLTDYMFDSQRNEWRRISEVFSEHEKLVKNGIYIWIVIGGMALMLWNFGGIRGMWDSMKILLGY